MVRLRYEGVRICGFVGLEIDMRVEGFEGGFQEVVDEVFD